MPQPTIWGRVLALAAIVMCTAFSLSASAGRGADPKGGFATLDFQKLSTGFKAKETVENELRIMQQKYDGRLARRDGMPFLTEEEQLTLDTLSEKTNPTEADTKKIDELKKKNQTKSDEIQAIRQKKDADLTDADKQKIKDADAIFQKGRENFAKLKDDLSGQINTFGKTKTDELMKRMRETVAKVAEQKGVAVVFNSEVALYAGTDITDQVINELNKK